MNMFKKNGGFTLVELIVVIAILAILAAVAVPAYSGYIQKANESADTALVESIETGLNAAFAYKGISGSARAVTVTVAQETGKTTYQATFAFADAHKEVAKEFASFIGVSAPTENETNSTWDVVVTGLKNSFGYTYSGTTGALTKSAS